MFGKEPADLTPVDIQRVCDDGWTENDRLEFKRTLPADGKDGDPWVRGESQIGRPAKKSLLRELIAFANAHGGWLLIGIEETDEKPGRANEVVPIRDCRDLADRLRLVCRDLIEPQLPVIQIEGVPIGQSGAGVIACYAPQSRAAPHRSMLTKDAYYRRGDRSEVMTMREIQDLTLNVERGMRLVDKRLEARRDAFTAGWGHRHHGSSFAIRVSAVPLTPLQVSDVHTAEEVRPPLQALKAAFVRGAPFELAAPHADAVWRPILRGTRATSGSRHFESAREVYSDGLLEYRLIRRDAEGQKKELFPGTLMCVIANALVGIERFRRNAGAAAVEYAMDIEIVTGKEMQVLDYLHRSTSDVLGRFPIGRQPFPRYSVGAVDLIPELIGLIERDFLNICEEHRDVPLMVDFGATFPDEGFEPWPPEWELKY